MNNENNLTIDFLDIEQLIRDMQVDINDTGVVQLQEEHEESLLVAEARGRARLSDETRALEEARLAKLLRKRRALRNRKKYTRKVGTVHPKKKAATRRRRLAKNWKKNPFGCLINGWGAHALDRQMFDQHIAPLWVRYNPEELTVVKAKRDVKGQYYGTKENPYTIYSLTVVHKADGVVFDGAGLELYELSS